MPHVIEPAASGRAKCRGCGKPIAKDELRFGERLPNPFADSEMTLWFHLVCSAYKRPESLDEVLQDPPLGIDDIESLRRIVAFGLEYHRVQRIGGIEQAPSGRARCRHCRETIDKDDWRIPLSFFEEGMFNASGFVHLGCASQYFDTADIANAIELFSDDLNPDDLKTIHNRLGPTRQDTN